MSRITADAPSGERALRIEGLSNARDLGGLPLAGGGLTPRGVFVRSERPDRVPAAGWAELWETGIRTVVDLRQQAERDRDRAVPPDRMVLRHVDHDGLEDAAFWSSYWDTGLVGTPLYYLPHLARMPERTVAVLEAVADAPPGGVLFHCAGGRDRTGLIAAALLTIAGVEPDAIVADYLLSIDNAAALAVGQSRPDEEAEVAALLARHGTTSEAAFRAFLDGLDAGALLARLEPAQAQTLRTWRGTLPAAR